MVQGKGCCMGYEAKIEMLVFENLIIRVKTANSLNVYHSQTDSLMISIHISPAS